MHFILCCSSSLRNLTFSGTTVKPCPVNSPFSILLNTYCWSEAKSLSRVRLCDPMDGSLPGISVHGILQARTLEWVTISFSRGSSRPRDQTRVSHIGGRRFNLWATRDWLKLYYDISFSRGSSWPRDRTQVSRIGGRRFNLWATRDWLKLYYDLVRFN